jgi:hypothetical protein
MTAPGPRGGDDTCGLIDDALATLAKRRSAWLGDDLTVIAVLASLIDQAGRCLLELVTNARLHSTAGTRSRVPWPPALTRSGCDSTPNPRSRTRDGPTTFSRNSAALNRQAREKTHAEHETRDLQNQA